MAHMSTEIELKLAIPAATAAKLRQHPLLGQLRTAPPLRRRLHNRYFDTPELALTGLGFALRLRKVGGRWLQTLKGGGGVEGGLHRREEWEVAVSGSRLDLSRFPDAHVRQMLTRFSGRLLPLFVTDFWRTTWQLVTAEGDHIELALDQGEITAAGRSVPISEIELELKAGKPACLTVLALALQQTLQLKPEASSKAERGYALYLKTPPAVVKAAPLALSPAMSRTEALRSMCWSCLSQLQGNEHGVLHLADPEYLHQMRVGLRRLRAAMSLIHLADPGAENAALQRELRWLDQRLGPARDWDVCVTQMLPALLGQRDKGQASVLGQFADKSRRQARASARRALSSARYARLLLTLSAWLSGMESQPDAQALTSFARQALQRRYRSMHQRGKQLGKQQGWHPLRIAAKKLRYSAEFFAPLYGAKSVGRYIKALTELQDVLGRLNDYAVAGRLFEELGRAGDAAATMQADKLLRRLLRESRRQHKVLKQAWCKFDAMRPFWEKA